jgi:ABC-type multidrug transport system ATPase subunit
MTEEIKHSNYLPFEVVKKDKYCGTYILDSIGRNVCDLYFMKNGKVVEFDDAEDVSELIVEACNNHYKLKRQNKELVEALERADKIEKAAIDLLKSTDKRHDTEKAPFKYTAVWKGLNELRETLKKQ